MREPGGIGLRERLRPAMVAALLAGAVIGGWAGAYMHGSGMFYSDLFVGAVLLVVVAVAGVGAALAARTRRAGHAQTLTTFVVVTVTATGALFLVSPPYRGADPGTWYFGRATMRIAELPPFEWPMGSRCKILDGEASVSSAEVNLRTNAAQQVGAAIGFAPSGSWPQPGIVITVFTMSENEPISPTSYAADFGSGATVVPDGADGLRGHIRFAADRLPGEFRSPAPGEPARVTGTLEWDCTVPPSP
jgi:hypothetical protein